MEIPASISDGVTVLDRSQFNKVREWIRPSFDLTGLRLLREKAQRERDIRELYRGRAPYELLQNADDAKATKAAFVLTPEGMGFAHNGKWFTVANFRSLADGWSDKDPKECIGHKGLGFRSVLDVTPAPHVIRVGGTDFFGFKFTWALNNGHIQEIVRKSSTLQSEYREWTKHGQSACPVMAIPGEARRASMGVGAALFDEVSRGVYGNGYTTMFWFPARDPDADRQVIEDLDVSPLVADIKGRNQLASFIEKEVSVLIPFLSCLEDVSLYIDRQAVARSTVTGNRKSEQGDEVRVEVVAGARRYDASFFQMHAAAPIPPHVKNDPHTPRAVRQMDKANFRLSIRLQGIRPAFDATAKFHVYFPTEEPTGFGFTVHGDFFVKPDRTRLMAGEYNNWLLDLAAKKLAGDFLARLLLRYEAKAVFEALRPTGGVSHDAARHLYALTCSALQKRKAPFIPSKSGPLHNKDVALPATVDEKGFWVMHFAPSVGAVLGKRDFLDPAADSEEARKFLRIAGVEPLRMEVLLDLIEKQAQAKPSADWWYTIHSYLARDKDSARWTHDQLAGKYLLPDNDLAVIAVPRDSSPVLCLPPVDNTSVPAVPKCFKSSFVFINSDLSRQLHQGSDEVRHWLLHACRIVQFEATDLLPRAIAASVRKFYDSTIKLSAEELGSLWDFLRRIIDLSRSIESETFWQDIGRLPVPLALDATCAEAIPPSQMAPAFLTYWPEGDPAARPCIAGIEGYRRLAPSFVPFLVARGGTESDWRNLLAQAGVSGTPKLLRYVRPIGGGQELPFVPIIPVNPAEAGFSGERQRDESLVVAENLRASALWREHVEAFPTEDRDGRSLQEVSLVDGLESCVRAADQARHEKNLEWPDRLSSLVHGLPVTNIRSLGSDLVFRRMRGGGGSNEPITSFLRVQIERLRWAPSTLGPVSPSVGFLRMSNRRFVSRGTSEDELGDIIAPYVVANQLDDYTRLVNLGFEPVEDSTAPAPALIRFIRFAGERLGEEWAKESILKVRGRWRLVRGAIQDAYRALNQTESTYDFPTDTRLAARCNGQVEFRSRPLYYAEPGSAVERAFSDVLPLFDADRVYQVLFERLGITRLIPGQTVDEEFCGESRAAPSSALHESILTRLAPHLLSVVIAKSEDRSHRDLVLRRLRERFDVQTADRLSVKFGLRGTATERTVDFPKFYLRRKSAEGSGAVREIHYTLFVVGRDDTIIEDLDGDALGDALSPVFFDGSRDDHSQMFPRIVSRFLSTKGSPAEMEEFLLGSLGISAEAQGLARDDIAGKTDDAPPIMPPQPPAAVVVVPTGPPGVSLSDGTEKKLDEHKDHAAKALDDLLTGLKKEPKGHAPPGGDHEPGGRGLGRGGVTREQEARGRKGEEEFLRRIALPGGWMGFAFVKDTRADETGYDFICKQGDREVKVEIKAFTADGRVILSANELRAAALHGEKYYLIGFIDSGPEQTWASRILQNPLPQLLDKGKFDLDVKLQAKASDIFKLLGAA